MARTPAPRVEITGAKELRAAMRRMNADMTDLTETNRAAAQPVLNHALDVVPRGISGALAGSIKISATRTRVQIRAGGRMVPYAGPIHFGWPAHNIAPQPFLYEALDARGDEVVVVYADRVEALVRKLDRETP